jgi:hypothetical protein
VTNKTNQKLVFTVRTISHEYIFFDSLIYSDTKITEKDLKKQGIPECLNKKLAINKIDSVTYGFVMNPSHTFLISPSPVVFPFDEISYELTDSTCILYSRSKEVNANAEIKYYSFKKTLIELK